MAAKIIDGVAISNEIKKELEEAVKDLKSKGVVPHLIAIQVGENPASRVYIRNQRENCEKVGIQYTLKELPESTTAEELANEIRKLNEDKSVNGIILQMPLPQHIDPKAMQPLIAPEKDVEGVNPVNMGLLALGRPKLAPCTAVGAVELIKRTVEIKGKDATMVGASNIVGKPVVFLLLMYGATPTVCHIDTKDVKFHTKNADILVVAVGKPNLITADMVKPGAVVIDIGINRVPVLDEKGNPVLDEKGRPKKKTVGDVDFENVKEVAGYITPVPGGVGPMTVTILLKNTVEATKAAIA